MPSAYFRLLVPTLPSLSLSHSPSPSLASSPPPPAVIVVLAFVLSARNVMRNCLCVLGVYDIIFVFLSVRLPPTLCVCLCVYKLHYTTSNITNDNKHLADTTRTTTVTAQQKQFHKNVFFFFCLRLPPQVCIMLYNLLMTLLMTVIATALGTAQIVVHASPLPPTPLCAFCLCCPLALPAVSSSAWHCIHCLLCSASTACRGISKWQFWVFRLFDCSACPTDSLPFPLPFSPLSSWLLQHFTFSALAFFVLAAHVSSSLAIFVGCICNRLIKWGKERKGKGIRGVANNGCDKQREYSVVKACKRHFKVTEFCSNQRGFFVLISLCVIYTLYILYIFPFSLQSLAHPTTWSSQQPWSSQCNLQHRHR